MKAVYVPHFGDRDGKVKALVWSWVDFKTVMNNNSIAMNRRTFLRAMCVAGVALHSGPLNAIGASSQIDIAQLIYSGGNWQPRPSALRRLAFELQKRTAIDSVLEPTATRLLPGKLASTPLLYMAGDRPFTPFLESSTEVLRRFLKLGGTLIVDPAYSADGDGRGFRKAVLEWLKEVLPGMTPEKILPGHVIFRSFYDLSAAAGLHRGDTGLTGYLIDERVAVMVGDHDMGGAWARDNLGNWEYDVPGGARQRENAFRLGVNLVMYTLCGNYKDEMPHKRFAADSGKGR